MAAVFALGDLDTSDRFLRLVAAESGVVVCGVDYALAPEARFPVQLEQILRVIGWLAASGQDFGIDTARLALGGDSAGANLALSAMLALRDGRVDLVRQGVLVYPMLSPAADTESHGLFGDGRFGLSTARLDWFWRAYVDTAAMLTDPRIARSAPISPACRRSSSWRPHSILCATMPIFWPASSPRRGSPTRSASISNCRTASSSSPAS